MYQATLWICDEGQSKYSITSHASSKVRRSAANMDGCAGLTRSSMFVRSSPRSSHRA